MNSFNTSLTASSHLHGTCPLANDSSEFQIQCHCGKVLLKALSYLKIYSSKSVSKSRVLQTGKVRLFTNTICSIIDQLCSFGLCKPAVVSSFFLPSDRMGAESCRRPPYSSSKQLKWSLTMVVKKRYQDA